jgi:hypothetical protein
MRALGKEDRIWGLIWRITEDHAVPASVRVRALDLAARLCGMFKRPSDLAPPCPAQLEAELVQRLRSYSG